MAAIAEKERLELDRGSATVPAPGAMWWAITVLFLAYTLSFVDRTVLALLVEPVKRDLKLSDTQISLLQGLAFAAFYTVLGLPIAALADRRSRKGIIALGIGIWSVMTGLCALATGFWSLFAARVGVGVGEAALSPAAYSLVGDLAPPARRGRAMAVYASGAHVGAGLALIIGGLLFKALGEHSVFATPVGLLRTWQVVFVVVSLPGVLVSLLALTIQEPPRGAPSRPSANQAAGPPAGMIDFLRRHPAAIALHFLGFSACGLISTAISAWAPSFMIRAYGYTTAQTGQQLGLVAVTLGICGALSGGSLSDRLTRRGLVDAPIWVGLLGLLLLTPAGILAPLAGRPAFSVALFGAANFFGAFAYPAGAAALQRLTPPVLRARLAAGYLMVVTLISAAGGPMLVALLSDHLFRSRAGLGPAMALSTGIAGPLGIIAFVACLRVFSAAALAANPAPEATERPAVRP
jgi:MFS family permease